MKERKGWEDIIKRFDDGLRADENINVSDKYGDGWEFNGEYHCDDLIEYCHNFIASELKKQRADIDNAVTELYEKTAKSFKNTCLTTPEEKELQNAELRGILKVTKTLAELEAKNEL